MEASNSLRDLDLEKDVVGILIDCPKMALQVHAGWFVNNLQAATVEFLCEYGRRDGLTLYLAALFDLDRGDVYDRLMAWRKGGWEYAPVTLLPQYAERLQELYTRREKLKFATRVAKSAFQGVAMSG